MQKENKFFFSFPNRWSSESHRACTFGRVVTEENVVNESTLGVAKVRKSEDKTKQKYNKMHLAFGVDVIRLVRGR